jgi:hypothetical protein
VGDKVLILSGGLDPKLQLHPVLTRLLGSINQLAPSVSRDAIMLSQSTSEMCVLTSETVEVATDLEWALVLLASRLMSTLKLTSYLLRHVLLMAFPQGWPNWW